MPMGSSSKWRKARVALSCLHGPSTVEDSSSPPAVQSAGRRSSGFISRSLSAAARSSESTEGTCAICLTTMKPGQGHAIFTAECSHSFHFHCITSNVSHGNQSCPVCRAEWKEIPFHNPSNLSRERERERTNTIAMPRANNAFMYGLRQLPPPREPTSVFDDDEHVDHQPEIGPLNGEAIDVKTYPEFSAVSRSATHNNFTILIHLKALSSRRQNSRAPVDLITVLDVSGSMAGTKLALLKRAMGFVIQHLGPSDRLSVISFSGTARRLFPLRRMTDGGRQEALQAVNGLSSNGGTNIAEGLRMGAKVMMDRKWKNPVGSIILLSDGQDTYTVPRFGGSSPENDYLLLLSSSINRNSDAGISIPVHAFGFGVDHDAAAMHSIAENSGGTFSFIEAESVIQDAFAQCIGGLLSVVVQELQVRFECVNPRMKLGSVKAGSYKATLEPGSKTGIIDFGDLYAEEERDFLVTVDIHPVGDSCNEMSLLKVKCNYSDPITKESVTLGEANINEVKIQRPETTGGDLVVSVEVDRQRNRLQATEAIEEARAAAERGDLSGAVSVLGRCLEALSETVSAQAGDQLCVALAAEIREMQERMANQRVYESSGRAYVLSGLSSHLGQRATARGDPTDSTSMVQTYQTQTMTDMVTHSQNLSSFGGSSPSVRPPRSFSAQPQPSMTDDPKNSEPILGQPDSSLRCDFLWYELLDFKRATGFGGHL
ncbi:hypothetical protein RHMOL_Rhmol13G0119500 [Rhododendron molle]|uniref:Uncharacterized protein n=1 Tax=Rhododendron molle TaxID=49168 RepID=A0ACC0L6C0_RHOML|nr:hypothetical protein RHMOL_Rhmol13G0119500 [Rhododendron molle]